MRWTVLLHFLYQILLCNGYKVILGGNPVPITTDTEKHLSHGVQLTFGDETLPVEYSNNGKRLSFDGVGKGYRNVCTRQAYILDTENLSEPPRRISTGYGTTFRASFVPNTNDLIYTSTFHKTPRRSAFSPLGDELCESVCGRHGTEIRELGLPCHSPGWLQQTDFDELPTTADIFRVTLDGAIVKQITLDDGFDGDADVAANGKCIVYTSMRTGYPALWIIDTDDTSKRRQLTMENVLCPRGATFCPDNKRVTFYATPIGSINTTIFTSLLRLGLCSNAIREIFTINVDGTGLRQVTHLGRQSVHPRYEPQHGRILFTLFSSTLDDYYNATESQLFLINENGSDLQQVTWHKSNRYAVFHPSGLQIAWGSSARNLSSALASPSAVFAATWIARPADEKMEFSLRNCSSAKGKDGTDGLEGCLLSGVKQLTVYGMNSSPNFGHDDDYIVYQHEAATTNSQIRAIGLHSYAPEYIFGRVSSSLGFACSPTALRFPYFRLNGFGSAEELIVYSTTELSSKIEAANENIRRNVFDKILYLSPESDLVVSNRFGQLELLLTDTAGCDTEPAVSTDGRRIAFTSCRSGDPDLWIVDVDGRNLMQLTNRTGYEGGASFSADGAKLVFHARYPRGRDELRRYEYLKRTNEYDTSSLEIYALNVDGTDVRRVTTLEARSATPAFIADDNWVMFSSNYGAKQFQDSYLFVMKTSGAVITQVTFGENVSDTYPRMNRRRNLVVLSSTRNSSTRNELNIFYAHISV